MDFLAPFFLAIILWVNPVPTYPHFRHVPLPNIEQKEFTIERIDTVKPIVNKIVNKKMVTKLGAVLSNKPSLFAEIDVKGIVLRVIVISEKDLATGKWGDPKNWVETKPDGSLRKNYAGIGYIYDRTLNAFIPPKPTGVVEFNEQKARWVDPLTKDIIPTSR